jgi:hypothetical protein
MMPPDERPAWELGGEGDESAAPEHPTNAPLAEEERGELAGDGHEEDEEAFNDDGEDTAAWDDEEPPSERSHEDEGELGAGSAYAAEDADEDEHAEPQGPAGAA